jgi:predicted naringenin-chalcone synthase
VSAKGPGPTLQLIASSELRKLNDELRAELELEKRRAAHSIQWRDQQIVQLEAELRTRLVEAPAKPMTMTMRHTHVEADVDTFGEKTQSIMVDAARRALKQHRDEEDAATLRGIKKRGVDVGWKVAGAFALLLAALLAWSLLSQFQIHFTPKGHTEAP